VEWAQKAIELGAGELLVNSIDTDGTKAGFDTELISLMCEVSTVPVVASGGAGTIADFSPPVEAGAHAVLAASVFHSGEIRIADVKNDLRSRGVEVR
jgi:cyclase